MVKILAITPIIGSTGDAVNERQVITAASRYSKRVFVITPISIKDVIRRSYKMYLSYRLSNTKMLLIPFVLLPYNRLWVLNFMIFILYSLMLSIIAYILDLRIAFDLIYVRDPRFALFISFFKRLSKKTFVKIGAIVEEEIHTSFLRRLMKLIVCSIDRHVMKRVAGIVVNSAEFAKRLVLRRQFLSKKIIALPPGITWSIIDIVKRYCPKRKRDVKDEIVVGFLGWLVRREEVGFLCDIAAELNRRGYKAKLKVVGDGPLRKYLINRCLDKGVEIEITGFLPHHRALCSARKEFDVLALPRIRSETNSSIVPIKVVEALALGIPVVVTDLPVYKRLEGKGLYTSKRTPKHFADIILKLLSTTCHSIDYGFLRTYSYIYNVRKFLRIALGNKS